MSITGRNYGLRYVCRPRTYTFDRIGVSSPAKKEELEEMLPLEKLAKHGAPDKYGRMVFDASNTAKHSGYQSKLDACRCTDEFVEILKPYDFGNITHLQICEDIKFNTADEAEMYRIWFNEHVERRWERNRFNIEETVYRSKKKDISSRNYGRCYINRNDPTMCRHEFVLSGKKTIYKVLGITDMSELGACNKTYWKLAKRYLKRPKFISM